MKLGNSYTKIIRAQMDKPKNAIYEERILPELGKNDPPAVSKLASS